MNWSYEVSLIFDIGIEIIERTQRKKRDYKLEKNC